MYSWDFDPDNFECPVEPRGYKVVVAVCKYEERTQGGVYIPDEYRSREDYATILGLVVALGPDAYKDEKRYPNGPYCKVGDWVIFSPYGGTRLKTKDGVEIRIMNDDTIDAVVSDPKEIERA